MKKFHKEDDRSPEVLIRKLDQAYELAGLARRDMDYTDEAKWLERVAELKKELKEARENGQV